MFGSFMAEDFLFRAIAFLVAITVHEFAHAFVAYRLGDPTPKMMGRITLNPIAHMDILGTLMILFGPIGWAKPVTFNAFNFKGNRRVGKILTTLAGPLANLITAILFGFLLVLLFSLGLTDEAWRKFFVYLVNATVMLNVILFLFNLLPIPPLDGYWIVKDLLPKRLAYKLNSYELYGPFLLLLLVVFGGLSWLYDEPYRWTLELIRTLTGLR
jgi:Zn-dependent protease